MKFILIHLVLYQLSQWDQATFFCNAEEGNHTANSVYWRGRSLASLFIRRDSLLHGQKTIQIASSSGAILHGRCFEHVDAVGKKFNLFMK